MGYLYAHVQVYKKVLTRKEPYSGRNFMGVTLDVLEGRRPQVPSDCPPNFAKLVKKCWHSNQAKRPSMASVLEILDQMVNQGDHQTSNA